MSSILEYRAQFQWCRPYAKAIHVPTGKEIEVISFPWRHLNSDWVNGRLPGNPNTLDEYRMDTLKPKEEPSELAAVVAPIPLLPKRDVAPCVAFMPNVNGICNICGWTHPQHNHPPLYLINQIVYIWATETPAKVKDISQSTGYGIPDYVYELYGFGDREFVEFDLASRDEDGID